MHVRRSFVRFGRVAAVIAAVALTSVAAVAARAVASPVAAGTTASTLRCTTSGLVVWLNTQGGGTAGSTYYTLELTHLSGRACTLLGYPGVSAVTLGGRRLGSAASRNSARPQRLVTLAPGATATAVLQIVDVYNFPRSACRPTMAAGLRVYPPNQTASKLVPYPFLACARTGPVYLRVQAVRKK
jgi:hypothetical protein